MFQDYQLLDDLVVVGAATDYPESVWQEVLGSRAYTKGMADLPAGSVMVDVGAHIGLASIRFARTVPDARVYAFEPASISYRCLAENHARHIVGGRVANFAVGSSCGEVNLTYYPHRSTMSTVHVDDEEDRRNVQVLFDEIQPSDEFLARFWDRFDRDVRSEKVPMTTLADALSDDGIEEIAFLKIDAERAELDVLRGIADEQWGRVHRLAVEVHDRDGRLVEIIGLLEGRGYVVEHFVEQYFDSTDMHMVYAQRR